MIKVPPLYSNWFFCRQGSYKLIENDEHQHHNHQQKEQQQQPPQSRKSGYVNSGAETETEINSHASIKRNRRRQRYVLGQIIWSGAKTEHHVSNTVRHCELRHKCSQLHNRWFEPLLLCTFKDHISNCMFKECPLLTDAHVQKMYSKKYL